MEPEPITPMTDEEAELFRFLRFGQLPERVAPAQTVESVQSEPAHDNQPPQGPETLYYR
ncbi:hypothetical protein [Hamadaea tsunoensis]|uniref:hypothetical protein n=1 Tax=Hamadaea tsunoensis TaxID=53368 RepID=UPI00041081C4|nr:hypothetical protein [Hamadaea tsunoensis]